MRDLFVQVRPGLAAFAVSSSLTSDGGTPSITISISFFRRASMRSISRSAADRKRSTCVNIPERG
jgi:hypothetical protein